MSSQKSIEKLKEMREELTHIKISLLVGLSLEHDLFHLNGGNIFCKFHDTQLDDDASVLSHPY